MPKSYSLDEREAIIAHICEELGKPRALSKICAEDEGMPTHGTICKWMAEEPLIAKRLGHARAVGATVLLEEIVDIGDERNGDVYIAYDKDGKPYAKVDGDVIQRAKLRVYTRERYAALIAPDLYGSKVDVTSGGEKLPAPAPTMVVMNRVEALMVLAAQRMGHGQPMIDITPDAQGETLDEIMD